jgi:hypothetical protein
MAERKLHWLCRLGFHDFGWTGDWGPDGKLMRCERGRGCRVWHLSGGS